MRLKRFKVIYEPFPESTVVSEVYVTGENEKDAELQFRRQYGVANLVSLEEQP